MYFPFRDSSRYSCCMTCLYEHDYDCGLARRCVWAVGGRRLLEPGFAEVLAAPRAVGALLRRAPRSLTAPLTRRALRTHVAGTRYDEAEEAAALFEGIGENKAAALLRLGLVRVDATSDRLEQAVRHATLSQQDAPSEKALATLCLAQLQSFGNAVPAVCQKVGWVSEKAASGKGEYEKLSAQLQNLPTEARANIRKHEQEIAEREAEQQGYRADLADIDRQKSEATADAVTGVIINLLPLPKSGATLESFVRLPPALCEVVLRGGLTRASLRREKAAPAAR